MKYSVRTWDRKLFAMEDWSTNQVTWQVITPSGGKAVPLSNETTQQQLFDRWGPKGKMEQHAKIKIKNKNKQKAREKVKRKEYNKRQVSQKPEQILVLRCSETGRSIHPPEDHLKEMVSQRSKSVSDITLSLCKHGSRSRPDLFTHRIRRFVIFLETPK